ncbi:MAG: M20/M25/M40 family metallo-hydrolase [Chloroflexi bacterium]|nr:M20/M25/M40 family metallo-hydrolase [Chloroflexota bacterium]
MAQPDPLAPAAVLDLLCQLVRCPSVNPTLVPDEGHSEAAIAALARDWLAARGVRAGLEEATPGRPNVVAEVGDAGGPTLVLCAHLDTVGTAGMTIPPFEPRVEGRRVYGRGSYDMKGGAAAAMAAAAALVREELRGQVLVALVADEEDASVGASAFVQRHRADGCVLSEPSDGKLILAHKGFVWAELLTRGRAAHGSLWELGVSAIGKMARVVVELGRFDQEDLRRRTHPLLGPASMHCGLVQGGVGLSTYAPECRLKVERRTLPGETPAEVQHELEEASWRAGEDAEVRLLLDRPALVCDREAPVVRCLREAVTAVTGELPTEAGVPYRMDAALFAAAGIPTANYGPSGAGAHEPVEWVDLDSVVTCARVLAEAARRFCASRPG